MNYDNKDLIFSNIVVILYINYQNMLECCLIIC